jgi:RNA ligase
MKVDLREFRKRSDYINERPHPKLDLIVWSYNHKCMIDNVWDEYTRMARGLITDSRGNIIQRPWAKFFNMGQVEETMIENLPKEMPRVYEKIDGSMGILFWNKKKPCIATKGSFESEQALWATKWIRKKKIKKEDFLSGYTYIFEVIFKSNRIVIDYGDREELVLLAVKNIEDGSEINYIQEAKRLGFQFAKPIKFLSMEAIMDYVLKMKSNEEGFVLKYKNGLRVKVKGQEYLRLHRLITGFSTISIWDCLRNKDDLDSLLKDVPDEFYDWVKKKREELVDKYNSIVKNATLAYTKVKQMQSRKEQASFILKQYKNISPMVFNLLDDKSIHDLVWKGLKPERELPFKEEV